MREPLRDIDITDDQPGPRKGTPLFGPGLPDFLGYLIGAILAVGLFAWVGREHAELTLALVVAAVFIGACIRRVCTGSWS